MLRPLLLSAGAFAIAAALPASLTAGAAPAPGASMPACKAGDTVVWVNTRSKVYYVPGASYYGKTKHGKYACMSDAVAAGDHAPVTAKTKHGARATSGSGAMDAPGSMGTPGAMGAPGATPTTGAAAGSAASGANMGANPSTSPQASPGPNATGSLKTNEVPGAASSSSPSP